MMYPAWQEMYKAALVELRPEELRLRIDTAEVAMHQRLRELEQIGAGQSKELQAIADALRNLCTLARLECKPREHFGVDTSVRREVAS
jgi:hypothetical protein